MSSPLALRYQPLVVVLLAAVGGILLDRLAGRFVAEQWAAGPNARSAWFGICCAAALSCLLFWWLLWRRFDAGQRKPLRESIAAALLFSSVVLCSAAWHHLRWSLFSEHEIGRFAHPNGEPVCIEAIALDPPEPMPVPPMTPLRAIPLGDRSRINLRVVAIRDETVWRAAAGNCQLIISGGSPRVGAGDRLRVFGRLRRLAPPLNPGQFDYAWHARGDRRLVSLNSGAMEGVSVVDQGSNWSARSLLAEARHVARRIVDRSVGPDRAELAAAILLGDRSGLSRDETEPYLVTGTIHLLVVSGMNVAILAMGLHVLARWGWIERRKGMAIIIGIVAAYALVAGADAPIMRATVTALAWCVAAWTGRRGTGFNALAAAALFVLALNPADLFRAGPLLSFLAVATLMVTYDRAERLRRGRHADRLDQLLAESRPAYFRAISRIVRWNTWVVFTTTVVWLATLPLVLNRFHVLTPIAILISPAVWLFVFVALWSGFGMLFLGGLFPWVGDCFGAVCDASLAGLEAVVHWAESAPAGHMWLPGPPFWWVIFLYAGLLAITLLRQAVPLRWQVAMVCAWVSVGFLPPIVRAATRNSLQGSFLAVGHGTCLVLHGSGGETLLYDAGALSSPEFAAQTVASYLWNRGILRIDGIVLSHTDVDHYNAVPALLDRFRVDAIYMSPLMFQDCGFGEAKPDQALLNPEPQTLTPADGPNALRLAIERAGVPVRQIWAGDRLRLGAHVTMEVLHPPRRGVIGNDNANSITLMVQYDGGRILLPGDLESPGLEDLIAELPRDCDVLLAPHHGSRRSDPPGFAAWSTPEWVVVSGGESDVSAAVRSYELAGADVFHTQRDGAVSFQIDGGQLSLAARHSGRRAMRNRAANSRQGQVAAP
jgi:competence protein ComEC